MWGCSLELLSSINQLVSTGFMLVITNLVGGMRDHHQLMTGWPTLQGTTHCLLMCCFPTRIYTVHALYGCVFLESFFLLLKTAHLHASYRPRIWDSGISAHDVGRKKRVLVPVVSRCQELNHPRDVGTSPELGVCFQCFWHFPSSPSNLGRRVGMKPMINSWIR